MTPPIRFLAAAAGSWACVRGVMLMPPGEAAAAEGNPLPFASAGSSAAPQAEQRLPQFKRSGEDFARRLVSADIPARPAAARPAFVPRPAVAASLRLARTYPALSGFSLAAQSAAFQRPVPVHASTTPGSRPAWPDGGPGVAASRWSVSSWIYARGGDHPGLVPRGMLGGSQAGASLRYRLSPSLSVAARLAAPLRQPSAADAALGVEWQPAAALPVRVLAERRQALGPGARKAFAVTLHGGVADLPVAAGFRLQAYGQAGAVGARSRDLFAEGSLRLDRPLGGGVSVGVGLWGAAQPGVSRLDAGPGATLRLPRLRASLSADWRFRAAGTARPASGPALTLWTDF